LLELSQMLTDFDNFLPLKRENFQRNSHTDFRHTLNMLLHYLGKFRKPHLLENYRCNILKACHRTQKRKRHASQLLKPFNIFLQLLKCRLFARTHATPLINCSLNGVFRGKDSASAALLRQCYTPLTDELAAVWHHEIPQQTKPRSDLFGGLHSQWMKEVLLDGKRSGVQRRCHHWSLITESCSLFERIFNKNQTLSKVSKCV